ncbi:MAG: hypothetical protein LAT75_08630, partial [Candidatus Cyclonatronum sp.]|uniref:sensor histidine kinase n=1 Tax=Cyclonatronum sp. TaxID=3024185 RepID=UPI0025C36B4D
MKAPRLPLSCMFSQTTLFPSARLPAGKAGVVGMLLVLLPFVFLAACTRTFGDKDAILPPTLFPQPKTVQLTPGQPVPATPIIMHPDSVVSPRSFTVDREALTRINAHPNRQAIPNERTTIPIDRSQLRTISLGEGDSDFALVSPAGETLPTGVPIPATGKPVNAVHSRANIAMPPSSRDAAIAHLQFLNVEHGLASSYVRAVLEDRSGNIWVGTRGGVSVYSGDSFTHFTVTEGLSNNLVRAILQDKSGNIWLGTGGGGVSVYNGESFTHYTVNEGLSNNFVAALLEDQNGNIWVGTEGGGVSVFDGESFTHYTVNEGLSQNTVFSLMEDQSGNIWIGTLDGGVNVFDGESFTHYTKNEGLSDNTVWSILEDQNGNIWMGTWSGGVNVFDGESFTHFTTNEGLSQNTVFSILEDQSGKIWLGTQGGGVNLFNGERFTHYTENEGLSHNTVWSILEDQSGNIWLGTEGGGLNLINDQSFTHYTTKEGISHNDIWSVLEDKSGNIWLGTWGGGVSVFNGESFTHYPVSEGLFNSIVMSILEDQSGNIWLGTGGGGVSVYNGESFTHYTVNQGLSNNSVSSILEDSSGNIWLGTGGGGVSVYNGQSFIHYTESEGLSSNFVFSIIEDKDGNIWLGTQGGGVSVFNGESFTHYTVNEGLSNNNVWSILEDKNGNIWLATEGGGVNIFNGESFTHFTINEGLAHNSVFSIIEDKSAPLHETRVFIGTENGLSIISLTEDPTSGGTEFAVSIQSFGKQDGLKSLRFNTGAIIDSKYRAWWSTGNGLTMLDLNTFAFSDKIPQPRLTHLEINEQFIDYRNIPDSDQNPIKFTGVRNFENYPLGLQLPYDKNHLTFYFAAIDWAAPHKVRYTYKIVGLDTYWSQPTSDPVADYRNLPFGTYTFQVRAIGESGVWSEPFAYTFTILPPWWHTWWAYGFYLMLFIFALYLLRRYELNRFNLKNQLEIEKVETETLRNLDQLKSHFFANISHEFRTPLTLIIGQIETLLDSEKDRNRKRKLVSVNRNAEQLLKLINQLLDLSKLEAGKMELNPLEHNIVTFLKNQLFSFESLSDSSNIILNFSSSKAT